MLFLFYWESDSYDVPLGEHGFDIHADYAYLLVEAEDEKAAQGKLDSNVRDVEGVERSKLHFTSTLATYGGVGQTSSYKLVCQVSTIDDIEKMPVNGTFREQAKIDLQRIFNQLTRAA